MPDGQVRTIGLIVNPVAGMGGRVGLKGSDGAATLRRARELGARPEAPGRAVEALKALVPLRDRLRLIVAAGEMGESECAAVGLVPSLVLPASALSELEPSNGRAADPSRAAGAQPAPALAHDPPLADDRQPDAPVTSEGADHSLALTTAQDTRRAARAMQEMGADLILFAGGDGTARDIDDAVGERAVVLGVPAGVKIHSGVYATTPRSAGDLVRRYLEGGVRRVVDAEVMDLDEDAFRQGRVSARLYGYLRVPDERSALQGVKASGVAGEASALRGIALDLIERLEPGHLYLLGPGTTTRTLAMELGLDKTLLGVDVLQDRQLIARDVTESDLLRLVAQHPATIVVTPIGGQGYVFGRGNQQISPAVIRHVGRDHILVIATRAKLASLTNQRLLVDTGDEPTNTLLRGHLRVITGYGQSAICRVS